MENSKSSLNRLENIVTEEAWNGLIEKAANYRTQIENDIEGGRSKSFEDILGNLAAILAFLPDYSQEEKTDEKYNKLLEVITKIERYRKLLEDFPEFAEKELSLGKGFFPEIFVRISDKGELIDAYESKLKG